MRRTWIAAAALLVGLVGCSDPDVWPAKYAQTLCAQNFKCCSAADVGSNTMKDCVDTNRSSLEFLQETIGDSQSRGRVRYDRGKMQQCIDAVAKLSCDEWSTGFTMTSQPAICDEAVVALVGMGGACRDDIDCTTGNCQGEDLANDVEGMCAASDSSGLSCTASEDCSPDFYCDANNTCAIKKFAGETCSLNEECRTHCNGTTSQCSCYAGCSIAGPASPRLICLLAITALILLATRRRRFSPEA
jgi:hypothetical protein